MIQSTGNIKHRLILKTLYGCGLRVSEIISLKKEDVLFGESLIHIKLAKGKKDRFVKVLVSDTGRGIPLSSQSLLFRKFQQAGESILTRDVTRGTGLGLYISHQIVQEHGGSLKVKSTIGEDQNLLFNCH